jgi:uncharacterized protein
LKRILLLSDTHGYLDDAILRHASAADEIWHAGDIGTEKLTDTLSSIKPLRAVYGNADGHVLRTIFPLETEFSIEGLKVWMIHIGGYPGHYPQKIKQVLAEKKPGLFICGHSHILKIIRDATLQLVHMNPGAAGIQGFHQVRTMIRFTVNKGQIHNVDVIELGPKGKSAETVR